jgi:hypothetical protein
MAAIKLVVDRVGVRREARACDVRAGTGKLTRMPVAEGLSAVVVGFHVTLVVASPLPGAVKSVMFTPRSAGTTGAGCTTIRLAGDSGAHGGCMPQLAQSIGQGGTEVPTEALSLVLRSEMASVLEKRDLLCPTLPDFVAHRLAQPDRRAKLWQPWAWRTSSRAPLEWCYFGFRHPLSSTVPRFSLLTPPPIAERREQVLTAAALGDFWMFGHWGHGINSYTLGLVARCGSLLLTQQVLWGGVYESSGATDRVNESVRAWNTTLAELARTGLDRHPVPEIVLVEHYRGTKHMQILPPPPRQQPLTTPLVETQSSSKEAQDRLAGLVDLANRHLDLLPDTW